MKLAAEHELLELFEVEPVLLDAGVPWAYNTLTFTTTRGDDVVQCVLTPGYGEIALNWSRDGRVLVRLTIGQVEAIRVELGSDGEKFVASFNKMTRLRDLIVQLKPFVCVEWGLASP
jgi:hypothetical protein